MRTEHCHDPSRPFTTLNYGITTTPSREWAIVNSLAECPDAERRHGRRIPSVDRLLALDRAVSAQLTRPEVLAVVLYTGPMVPARPPPAASK